MRVHDTATSKTMSKALPLELTCSDANPFYEDDAVRYLQRVAPLASGEVIVAAMIWWVSGALGKGRFGLA